MNEQIISLLIHNQGEFKILCSDYTKQYKEQLIKEPDFVEEITNQYVSLVRSVIIKEISEKLGTDSESVNVVLDNLNVLEYINL